MDILYLPIVMILFIAKMDGLQMKVILMIPIIVMYVKKIEDQIIEIHKETRYTQIIICVE